MNLTPTARRRLAAIRFPSSRVRSMALVQQPVQQQQKLAEQGIAIEFTVVPQTPNAKLKAGEDASIRFKVTDTMGTPVKGLNLSAWISLRARDEKPANREQCHDKIQS